jgi:DUF1680 family protein
MQPAGVDAVKWADDGFWGQRLRQTEAVTVRRLWELLDDPDAGHVLDNFRIAAGIRNGDFQGTWWQDAWLYKWIEAAACLFRTSRDSWLDRRMDLGIELIAAAQAQDGYLATQTRATGFPRFSDIRRHEAYTMGHLLTAAVIHHRMTGKTSLLAVARRVADFLCEVLGTSVRPCFAHNPSAIMGLVEMYRETGAVRYLACAQLIVDARGAEPAKDVGPWWLLPDGLAGTDQIQDRVPLREAQEVVGHNVFFTYLFAGAADVFLETGDESLASALRRLWGDLVKRKISVNGGVSPMGQGLSLRRDTVVEAVGPAYFLPNADSYNETCGQIGNLLWNARMLLADPDARYADMVEHQMFNGILSGIGTDGHTFWYRNPLRADPAAGVHGHNAMSAREEPGRRRICCPTNILRTLAQWSTYAYSVDTDGIWVHQYGTNSATLDMPGLGAVKLTQTTDYPWEGSISLRIVDAPSSTFAMHLRVPSWAAGYALRLNGDAQNTKPSPSSYVDIVRTWRAGDTLELSLPMDARLIEAHPEVEQCRNQVAVMRGPVLYCLESVDLPGSMTLSSICIPSDMTLKPVPFDELGLPLVALEGTALQRVHDSWGQTLYRGLKPQRLSSVPLRLIPYFAWANRGISAMSVWLPVAWR